MFSLASLAGVTVVKRMDAKYTKHDHIAGSMQGITRSCTLLILSSLRLVVLPCHPSFVHAVELAVESEVIQTNTLFSYSLRGVSEL